MSMKSTKKKWRGIHTTQKKINELKPITKINRLGQKTISLPRIDDKKRWAGYPGIAGIAKKVAKLIPFTSTYVEPFAGTVKVYQEFLKLGDWNYERVILNDFSPFVCKWLRREFPEAKITQHDFVKSIKKYDSKNTFFMFDCPWFKSYYDQAFSMFNRKDVREYSEELVSICKNIKGKFIIASKIENTPFRKSDYYHKTVTSTYVTVGRYPKVLLTSNFDMVNHHKK